MNLHQNLVLYGSHAFIYANKNLMGAIILIADQGGKKGKGKIRHRKYLTCERQHKILGKRIRIIYGNRHLCQG